VTTPNIPITAETISIVMTACNRSKQTYFTLQTIQNSSHKAIQIILVDDSDAEPITKEELEKYPFYIDFISIKMQNKKWVNPVVNYNIGFEYIRGSKVVIQNAEVCHVGDV
jgi:glycosyltransferase involved in cell wall biosynthesis